MREEEGQDRQRVMREGKGRERWLRVRENWFWS